MTHSITASLMTVVLLAPLSAAPGAVQDDDVPRLRARVYPTRAYVRVESLVLPAEENRSLEIVAESSAYYRSSLIELEGDRAPRLHTVEFRAVPPGRYEVRVAIKDGGGDVRAISYHRVMVIG
jgi:hypothetical protein